MNLISKLYTGRNISKTLSKKFASLVTRLGGEERLTEVFADNCASSVAEQAAIVNQLQDGVAVADIAVASRGPAVDANKLKADKARLISILGGQKAFADFISSNGGFGVKNMAVVIPKELARLGSGGTPTASTTKPATAPRQLIRLGSGGTPAAAPTKPTTAPRPSTPSKVHEFVPAKPATKPRASGTRPEGAFSLTEARERTAQVFGYTPGYTPSQNEKSQWRDLESVYTSAGHPAPWVGEVKTVDRHIGKIDSALYAKREAAIAKLFETRMSRSDFAKLCAGDQSNYCKNGGKLTD